MAKVKTFAIALKVFHTASELADLDKQVNSFIEENGVSKVLSVSDACTTDNTGATIGVVRVMAYE